MAAACGADFLSPAGKLLVFGCDPEQASPCDGGAPAAEAAAVRPAACCSGFLSPAAWFSGWTAPAAPGRLASTEGMYTPNWFILAAACNREERCWNKYIYH